MNLSNVKLVIHRGEDRAHRFLAAIGLRQSDTTIAADAQNYWARPGNTRWESDSHWRTGSAFADNDLWPQIGQRHLAMFERAARTIGFKPPWGRILEWGCGGGANAIHFAPCADEFIGVDISTATLDECSRQVTAACGTPWQPVRIDVDRPEQSVSEVGAVDVWLSYYVFELVPTPEYGERLLRIAHRMLRPGGVAHIQIKYSDGRWVTRPRRRSYRSGLAEMTTYRIDEFWQLAEDCGFTAENVELVPRNELDERYAYFLLTRSDRGSARVP